MVLGLLAGAGRRAVETVYGWRQFEFGPPTGEYRCRASVTTNVEWQRLGASVEVQSHEDSVTVVGSVGPLGCFVMVARREPVLLADSEGRSKSVTVGDHLVYVYRTLGHVGAVVEWSRYADGLRMRAKVGPVGVLVEPADVAGV